MISGGSQSSGGGARSGYSVILFDNLVTGFGAPEEDGTGMGRKRVLRMLQSIPEGEKIALYAIGWKLQIVREFTTDRESLEQRLQHWKPNVDTADLTHCEEIAQAMPSAIGHSPAVPDRSESYKRAAEACGQLDAGRRLEAFDAQLQGIADHLAGVPGRKNLIWMANRFPIVGGPTIQRLINANVAIYPVDEAGVCRLCPPRPKQEMRALAALTGGLPFFERNDLDMAVREAMDDGRISYTLGFYQPQNQQPAQDQPPGFHQLSVKVSRPDVTLRYRTSYLAEPPRPPSANPVADLVEAMNRPADATAIGITASANRSQDQLNLGVKLDLAGLDLDLDQGLWHGQIELVTRFQAVDGTLAGDAITQAVTLNLKQNTYEGMQKDGFPYRRDLKIPPKAVELKFLVTNLATGKIGTLTIPLPEIK